MDDVAVRAARLVADLPIAVDRYLPREYEHLVPRWSPGDDGERRVELGHIIDKTVDVCADLEFLELGLRTASNTSAHAAAARQSIRITLALLEHAVLASLDATLAAPAHPADESR